MKTQKGFKRFTALFLTFAVIATLVSSFTFGVSAKEDNDTSAGQLTYVFTPIAVNIGTYDDFTSDEYEAEEGANAIEFLSSAFSEAAAYEKTGWELVRGGIRSYVTEDTVLCDGDTYYMIWGLANDGVLGIFGTCTADMFEDIEYNSYVMSDYGGVLDIYHTIDGVEYRFAVDPVNFTIGDIFPLMDIDTSKTYTVNGVEVSYRDQLPLKSTAFETLATGSITVESDPFLYNKVKKLHYFVKLKLERLYEHSIITDDELGFTSGGVIKILDEDGKAVYTVDEEDANIDEDDYGYTLVCVKGELPKGKYTVIFEKPGYVTLSEEILIEKNANNYEFTPVCGDIRGSYEEHLGDGKVDFDDFIRVLRGINENSSELLRLAVDLNEDGIVNVNDLAIIKASIAAE